MARNLFYRVCCVTCAVCLPSAVSAQEIYRSQMTDGAAWGLVANDLLDASAEFGFDYSGLGIPEAPHSQPGDTASRGLQMMANLTAGVPNAIAAFPTGLNFSGKYVFQFDMWINAIGPFPEGGNGSTELGGGSVGFNNATTDPSSGAGFRVSGEAGTTRDYRLYAHNELQTFPTHLDPDAEVLENDLFDPKMTFLADDILLGTCPNNECGGDNADGSTYLQGLFPGLEPPLQQQNDYFLDQFGTTKNGSAAFQWMTVKFTVDTDAGTAFVQITSDTSGGTADVGTFTLDNTYVNRATIDTKLITDFEGNISLVYHDAFASLVQVPELSFGLFDNVIVTQLESGTIGDYNEDGFVDAADYTVWRDRLGQNSTLPNEDSNVTPGMVTPEDYDVWKAAFGNSGGGSGAVMTSGAVPEPASCWLLVTAIVVALAGRRWT